MVTLSWRTSCCFIHLDEALEFHLSHRKRKWFVKSKNYFICIYPPQRTYFFDADCIFLLLFIGSSDLNYSLEYNFSIFNIKILCLSDTGEATWNASIWLQFKWYCTKVTIFRFVKSGGNDISFSPKQSFNLR